MVALFCRVLNSTDDLSDWLDSAYSYLAMVDYPYPANFMMPLPGHPIREVYIGKYLYDFPMILSPRSYNIL